MSDGRLHHLAAFSPADVTIDKPSLNINKIFILPQSAAQYTWTATERVTKGQVLWMRSRGVQNKQT